MLEEFGLEGTRGSLLLQPAGPSGGSWPVGPRGCFSFFHWWPWQGKGKIQAHRLFCGKAFSKSLVRNAGFVLSVKPGNICAGWVLEFAEVASPPLLSNMPLGRRWTSWCSLSPLPTREATVTAPFNQRGSWPAPLSVAGWRGLWLSGLTRLVSFFQEEPLELTFPVLCPHKLIFKHEQINKSWEISFACCNCLQRPAVVEQGGRLDSGMGIGEGDGLTSQPPLLPELRAGGGGWSLPLGFFLPWTLFTAGTGWSLLVPPSQVLARVLPVMGGHGAPSQAPAVLLGGCVIPVGGERPCPSLLPTPKAKWRAGGELSAG